MLRITQKGDAASAKSYYTQGDYYLGGEQEMVGRRGGKAALRLGLAGDVGKYSFDRLCDNLHLSMNKQQDLTMPELREVWNGRLTSADAALVEVRQNASNPPLPA